MNGCHQNVFTLYRRADLYEVILQVFANRKGKYLTSFSVGFRVDEVAGARLRDARTRLSVSSNLKRLGGATGTCIGTIDSVACSSFTNSTVLSIPTSQRGIGRRNEENRDALPVHRSAMPTMVARSVGKRLLRTEGSCLSATKMNEARDVYSPHSIGYRANGDGAMPWTNVVTWLILPVVICLSQRLSHACLSTNFYTVKLRMAH